MKTLFFHNTMVEYRTGFFEALDKKIDLKMVFTDFTQGNLIYKNQISNSDILEKSVVLEGNKIKRIKKAVSCIRETEYDWIILPTLDDIYSIVLSSILLLNRGKSKVCYFWEKWESPKDKQPIKRRLQEIFLKILVRPILKKVTIALYPGQKTKDYYESFHIKNLKMMQIHDVSLISEDIRFDVRKKYRISDEKKIILFLGRIVKIKGLDTLMYAFSKCEAEYLEKHVLIVAGDGDELSTNKELTNRLGLKNVYFVGQVKPEDRYTFFCSADIFVLPDRYLKGRVDAWGLTVNEALQCGCYVIVSTAAGAAYDLINANNGVVFEENNIAELTNALEKCSQNDVLKNAKKQALKFIEEYNYERMAEDFKEAMEWNK